jgi:hypothetical protein
VNQDWDIKPCSSECSSCGKAFEEAEVYFSELVHGEEGYRRIDNCAACNEKAASEPGGAHSTWQGAYRPPPPPPEEVLEKETAESLLRRLIESEDESKGSIIYVLAVMLERKKILVEKSVNRTQDGPTIIVYEHRKTGESIMVTDPHLRLDELEHVQSEVVELLGGKRANEEPVDDARDASEEDDLDEEFADDSQEYDEDEESDEELDDDFDT